MDLTEILSRPEGKTLEFKGDLSSPDSFLRSVVAFANTASCRCAGPSTTIFARPVYTASRSPQVRETPRSLLIMEEVLARLTAILA